MYRDNNITTVYRDNNLTIQQFNHVKQHRTHRNSRKKRG